MSTISLNSNIASLNGQRRLSESTASLSKTNERLASGLRINRAGDDAAGLAVSASLDADARVFNQGVRNISDGVSYLNIAEGATTELKNIVIRMRELATQSSNGTISDKQRIALQKEVFALSQEYNRIVETTEFNGVRIFDDANVQARFQGGYGSDGTLIANLGAVTTGDGTYTYRQSFGIGTGFAYETAVFDFNGDGNLDIFAATSGAENPRLYLGRGDGTFQSAVSYNWGNGAGVSGLAIGDVNGDGMMDAIGVDDLALRTMLGNGNGTFKLGTLSNSGGGNTIAPEIADLNGDGFGDVLVPSFNDGTVSISISNGNGTFLAPRQYSYGGGSVPHDLVVKDFNSDGIVDFASANAGTGEVSIRFGNGDGTFGAARSYYTGNSPANMSSEDFNRDGIADLAITIQGGAFAILLGNADGTFKARLSIAAAANPYGLLTADVNNDGLADVLTTDNSGAVGTIHVSLGNGDGSFRASYSSTLGGGNLVFLNGGDFNNDGSIDLVASHYAANATIAIALGGTKRASILRMSDVSVATRNEALAAQSRLDEYLRSINATAGQIGASTSRLETTIATLQSGSENFTAARSRIVDADVALESANLVRSRILQQAGAAVLAQANQGPRLALTLLS